MDVFLEPTPLPDVVVVRHQVFRDDRGFFMEVYRRDLFEPLGLPADFVQLNHSRSARGVVRGLHFQWQPPMGKLMRVTSGRAFLVAVDIRKGSPSLGEWFGIELSEDAPRQVWAPAGFARGFAVLSDHAEIEYLCTGTYNPAAESGIRWDDPEIGIEWPLDELEEAPTLSDQDRRMPTLSDQDRRMPALSDKDRTAQSLAEWLERPESDRFVYTEGGSEEGSP